MYTGAMCKDVGVQVRCVRMWVCVMYEGKFWQRQQFWSISSVNVSKS